jgi:D-glycerate 3-kinase
MQDQRLQNLITELELPDEFSSYIPQFLDPVAAAIHQLSQFYSTAVIGINGSQGSGKSTTAAILQVILESKYKHRVVVVSIDDFYHTKAKRSELSQLLHPLFITRGVPGTHNIHLAIETLSNLKKAIIGETVYIPRFDKAIDDIKAYKDWQQVKGPVSIILFEGWCVAAPPLDNNKLLDPINDLEDKEDKNAIWRKISNQFLKGEYQTLFNQIDWLLMLKAPNFDVVFEWRLLQEKKLRKKIAIKHSQLLNTSQLTRFIQHYQRLTEHCLLEIPARANAIITLNKLHKMTRLHIKKGY